MLKVLRTNSFGVFLKSMVERLGVTGQNTITTVISLFYYPVDVIVYAAARMCMPTEMGKHLSRSRNEKRSFAELGVICIMIE